MEIKINFINRSNDRMNSEIFIFTKGVETPFKELSTAWTVVKNLGHGESRPFVFPFAKPLNFGENFGNYTPNLSISEGNEFEKSFTQSKDQSYAVGAAYNPKEVAVSTNLPEGAINASIYKDGKLLAAEDKLAPQQDAALEFKPTIWIGVTSPLEQGQVIDSAILSEVNTELSLLDIQSADIVMTGGGSGSDSQPFSFHLENVVMA